MKQFKRSLILVALTIATSSYAITWDCGLDPTNNMAYTPDVKATLENISGESVLRIHGSGSIANFNTYSSLGTGSMTELHTYAPWDEYVHSINRVIVESGVDYIGQNTFKYMDDLRTVEISKSVKAIGKGAFNKYFSGSIYFSCTKPEDIPDVSEVDNNPVPPAYYQDARVYVPKGMHDAFAEIPWFLDFDRHGNLLESIEAGAVVSVSEESADKNTVLISIEIVENVQRFEILVKDAKGNEVRHYYAYYSNSESKWVIEPIGSEAAAHRIPAIHRDGISATDAMLQLDITELQASAYTFTITGYDDSNEIIFEREGQFNLSGEESTAIDTHESTADDAQYTRCYNVLGQQVDEYYRGIIITETGRKLLK